MLEIFSVLPGNSGHNTLRVPLWGPMFRLPLCPFNLGGDQYHLPRPLNLTDAHYGQTDISLNQQLWAEHPWNLTNFTQTGDFDRLGKLENNLSAELQSTLLADKQRALPDKLVGIVHERLRIVNNIATLELMWDTLSTHGFLDAPPSAEDIELHAEWNKKLEESISKVIGPRPLLPEGYGSDWVHPRIRKQSAIVEPVRTVINRVMAKKKIVTTTYFNAGNPILAAREYIKLLLELYPWTASPLFFTNNDAFLYGIAQLESELWVLLGVSALRAGRLTDHYQWFTGAKDCFDAILNLRYTTCTALSKICFVAHEAHAARYRLRPESINAAGSLLMHEAVQAISDFILGHSFALADKKDGSWAHKDCVEHHVCNDNQEEAYELMYQKWGPDAIMLPNGLDGDMVVKVDPSVNDS